MNSTAASRRRIQFSLRKLMAFVAVCALALAGWASLVAPYRAQSRTIAELTEHGAQLTTEPASPAWLRPFVGTNDFVNIIAVDFSGAQTQDAHLTYLQGLTTLRGLSLHGASVTDAGLVPLKYLSNLQVLDLGETNVTDVGIANLRGLSKLQRLRLTSTQISDIGLQHLRELTNLEVLLVWNSRVTGDGIIKLRTALPDVVVDILPPGWKHVSLQGIDSHPGRFVNDARNLTIHYDIGMMASGPISWDDFKQPQKWEWYRKSQVGEVVMYAGLKDGTLYVTLPKDPIHSFGPSHFRGAVQGEQEVEEVLEIVAKCRAVPDDRMPIKLCDKYWLRPSE